MNGDAVLNLIMGRLANRSSTTTRATCLAEMALLQDELEKTKLSFHPWFLCTDDKTTLVTVADTETVALPSDFVAFDEEWGQLYIQDAAATVPDDWNRLTRKTFDFMKEEYKDSVADTPVKFDIVGEQIYLRPIPDAVFNLRILYYAQDSAPTDAAAENNWLKWAPSLLMSGTLHEVATKHLRDTKLAATFLSDMNLYRQTLFVAHESRATIGHNNSMGDD